MYRLEEAMEIDGKVLKRVVKLKGEKELRIFMLPLRQKILRVMQAEGKPITSKHIADILGISPSSARHHLMRLEEIGLVEHDHYELVNGIKANYLRPADVTVSIGTDIHDNLSNERDAITAALIADISSNFHQWRYSVRSLEFEDPRPFIGDLYSGIAHLDRQEAFEFYQLTRSFLEAHANKHTPTSHPWEFAFIFYDTAVGAIEKERGSHA